MCLLVALVEGPMSTLSWGDHAQAFHLHPLAAVSLRFTMAAFLCQTALIVLACQLTAVDAVCVTTPMGVTGRGCLEVSVYIHDHN